MNTNLSHSIVLQHDDDGDTLSAGRKRLGWFLALLIPLALTLLFRILGTHENFLNVQFLSYLVGVVITTLIGGLLPALFCAILGSLILNYFFVPPTDRFTISEPENIVAILLYLLVAFLVARVVSQATQAMGKATRLQTRSQVLSNLAEKVISENTTKESLLEDLKKTYQLQGASLLHISHDKTAQPLAATGTPVTFNNATKAIKVRDHDVLYIRGSELTPADTPVLEAYALALANIMKNTELAEEKEKGRQLNEANKVRTSLLNAVSHDLRTPLAGIKAAVSSLKMDDIELDASSQKQLLDSIDISSDKLNTLVSNLLDSSRIEEGELKVQAEPCSMRDIVQTGMSAMTVSSDTIVVEINENAPKVLADHGLASRIVGNLLNNAVQYGKGKPIQVQAQANGDYGDIHVIDHGIGMSEEAQEQMFKPFQRFDDSHDVGLGLGLAAAEGLAQGMGGFIVPENTPGEGLTMTLKLPIAKERHV